MSRLLVTRRVSLAFLPRGGGEEFLLTRVVLVATQSESLFCVWIMETNIIKGEGQNDVPKYSERTILSPMQNPHLHTVFRCLNIGVGSGGGGL